MFSRTLHPLSVGNVLETGRKLRVIMQSAKFNSSSRDDAFKLLGLSTFSDEEIKKSFHALKYDESDTEVKIGDGVRRIAFSNANKTLFSEPRINKIVSLLSPNKDTENKPVMYSDFKKSIVLIGEKLDNRVWSLGTSFLFTGTSVGIVIPCMPLLVTELNIPSSHFGLVISAFGLSKLIGNIPSGYLVEKYGRKAMLVSGLAMCGIGIGSIGLTLMPGFGTSWLVGCRFVSGLGVSAFVAGGYMFMSDISNPLNRTRTIAPVMAGFSAGAALGPAVGGFLIDAIGVSYTYFTVGGLISTLAVMNQLLMTETMASKDVLTVKSTSGTDKEGVKELPQHSGIVNAFTMAFDSWRELFTHTKLRELVTFNGTYWYAYAGAQMTLLPLFMVSPVLHLTPYEIGGCFAYMSVIALITANPSAIFADKLGKELNIVTGGSLVAASVFCLPLVSSLPELVMALTPLAVGATMLNSTPTALAADLTTPKERAQALSLLRTMGDVGLLFGASCSGLIAHFTSIEVALEVNSAVMAAGMMWFGSKNISTIFKKKESVI